MGLLPRKQLASIEPYGSRELLVRQAAGTTFCIDVAGLPWVLFIFSGDALYANDDGWYVLPFSALDGTKAVALNVDCPGLERAMRDTLRPAVDSAARLLQVGFGETPRFLRGAATRRGVAFLNGSNTALLLNEQGMTTVRTAQDFPCLP